MPISKRYLLVFLAFASFGLFAQEPVFDKLELLYSQGHYKMVYRRANRLLDIPDYDYSQLPKFYMALSLFQLSEDEDRVRKKPNTLEEAVSLFRAVKQSTDGSKVFQTHILALVDLKSSLSLRVEEQRKKGNKTEADRLKSIITSLFDVIPDKDVDISTKDSDPSLNDDIELLNAFVHERDLLVNISKMYLGIPYVWAGIDTSGFDCSGFTCFIMKQQGKDLPRRAIEQYDKARKINPAHAQKGDLVFFDGGSGISHVGMLISERGKPLVMIHASTSSGVIITEIEKSDYWLTRLKGFGTYIY
jgi:cell wall-associated NlpC family hydrolase